MVAERLKGHLMELEEMIDAIEDEIDNPDARHDIVTEALINISYIIEDGEVPMDDERLERLKTLLKERKETILEWDGLYDDIKSYRKDHPRSHWWWYPEKW